MKNRASSGVPYCWLAMMFAECCTRKLDTAYTMPGLSGQDSVRMNSRPVRSSSAMTPTIRDGQPGVKGSQAAFPRYVTRTQMYPC